MRSPWEAGLLSPSTVTGSGQTQTSPRGRGGQPGVGVTQAEAGVTQPGAGVTQVEVGVTQPGVGVTQR